MTERHLTDNEISEYALGLMDTAGRHTADAHLGDCVECAEQVRSIEHVLGLAVPPRVPEAGDEQAEASWQAILGQVADSVASARTSSLEDSREAARRRVPDSRDEQKDSHGTRWLEWLRPAFGGMPRWSWQMAQVAVLAGLGFAAAWYLAGQGWLPGTQPLPDLAQQESSPSIESTRGWLAANGYTEQLEVLLLDLARGEGASGAALTPTVKEVSRNLLTDARWYRRAADRAGDPVLVDLLSEIEILLLAVATVPEGQEDDLVAILRDLIDDQDLLWRLRSVRGGEGARAEPDVATFGSSG